jgi:ATP-dependent RNA helicase RhlE
VPENPEDYVHRIGRTGRAMAVGDAFTLVSPENADDIRDIQRFIGAKIPELRLEGFPYAPFVMNPSYPKKGQQQRRGGGGGGGQRLQGQSGQRSGGGGQGGGGNRSGGGGGFRGRR